MKLPREVPVMTLPNVTLFPQALVPLYIFEPRYRQMLADALHSHRMFSVAMRKPGSRREIPAPVAGLGLIRVCVGHKDGTSHLILQGIARVKLEEAVRHKPYLIQRIRPLPTPACDSVAVDALLARMRELLRERFELGMPFPFPFMSKGKTEPENIPPPFSPKEMLCHLDSIANAEEAVDLVSCSMLQRPSERQAMLEILDVETRLRRLIRYLLREIREHRKENHE